MTKYDPVAVPAELHRRLTARSEDQKLIKAQFDALAKEERWPYFEES